MTQNTFQQQQHNQGYISHHFLQHLFIPFRIGRTWFLSIFIIIILMAAFIALTTIWFRNRLNLEMDSVALVISVIIALLVGVITAEWLAISAYRRTVKKELGTAMKSCYPDTTPFTGKQNPDANLLILGQPGTGKTKELEKYLFLLDRKKIPILIPMKYYDGFLTRKDIHPATLDMNILQPQTLLAYLLESHSHDRNVKRNEIVGIQHLRPFLQLLIEQGRIMFLCDGLNELSATSLDIVCKELKVVMEARKNRVIMTCRELDYKDQSVLKQFIREGLAIEESIPPLLREDVSKFTELYLRTRYTNKKQKSNEAHIHVIVFQITKTNLRYDCSSPFILVTLIDTLESMGTEQAGKINSRGRLLQQSVTQLLNKQSLAPQMISDMHLFLRVVACTARRTGQRNAISLGRRDRATSIEMLADAAVRWLEAHKSEEETYEPYDRTTVANLLEVAQKAEIITLSSNGVLSFKHELIAEYFVADYLNVLYHENSTFVPFWQDMFLDEKAVGAWSEPVAFWAGLVESPMELADHLVEWAEQYNKADNLSIERSPDFPEISMWNVLMISLACMGVVWSPSDRHYLPPSLQWVMQHYMQNRQSRERLAFIFKRCADEGGSEVYRSLPPLLSTIEGLEDLLLQLDKGVVPNLLFDHLQEVAEQPGYKPQVEAIQRVLGRFGAIVIARASVLSTAGHNEALRLAAIGILGRVREAGVVEILIEYFSDPSEAVYRATVNALINLGPELTLTRLEQVLHGSTPVPSATLQQARWCILNILENFLLSYPLSIPLYRRVIASIISFLASDYTTLARAHERAKDILFNRMNISDKADTEKRTTIIEQLLGALSTVDVKKAGNIQSVLRRINSDATPFILICWQNHHPPAIVRQRTLEVMGMVRDPNALDFLVSLLNDDDVQEQLGQAFVEYAPDNPSSIELLIQKTLDPDASDTIARRAAEVLKKIGAQSLKPVCAALPQIRERSTSLLVEVLDYLKDTRAIRPLADLLQQIVPNYQQLAVYVMQVLGHFKNPQVIAPLVDMLERSESVLYQKAIEELSQLGGAVLSDVTLRDLAKTLFDALFSKLNSRQETLIVQRTRSVLMRMRPFPLEQLLNAFRGDDALAEQVKQIFKQCASESVTFLVSNLFHPEKRIQSYVRVTIEEMDRGITAYPLVEALSNPGWQPVIAKFLLKNPASIPYLIQQFGNVERDIPAYTTLMEFDSRQIIPYLILGLQEIRTRPRTRHLIEEMIRREETLLLGIIRLFNPALSHLPSLPPEARTALQEVLTQELADKSLHALIQGLRDRLLVDGCSNTLAILARQQGKSVVVVQAALSALRDTELRFGARQTLVRIGEPALRPVSDLLSDPDLVDTARDILSDMGPLAFPILHELFHDPQLAQEASAIFRRMSTANAAVGLVKYLASNDLLEIELAQYLLYTRIDEEDRAHKAEMIPALLEQAQREHTYRLRIMASLLLFNGSTSTRRSLASHIVHSVMTHPTYNKEFMWILPFLGDQAVKPLENLLNKQNVPSQVQEEATGVLGILRRQERVEQYVTELASNTPQLFSKQTRQFYNPLHLRAFGGLLASGKYNRDVLMQLRAASQPGSAAYEFYDVLLGSRNMPELKQLREDLTKEKDNVDRLTKDLNTAQASNTSLETQNRALNNRLSGATSRNTDLSTENVQLRQQVTQLEQQVFRLQHQQIIHGTRPPIHPPGP